MDEQIEASFELVRQRFGDLQSEIAELRNLNKLKFASAPELNKLVVEALQKALACEIGWRENARLVLGEYALIECECGASFPSGGYRKKTCGRCEFSAT